VPDGVDILNVDQIFGGWTGIQARFFADGGIFDQIYETGR
jgi:ABC-type sulfate transport system substrate-binding protein